MSTRKHYLLSGWLSTATFPRKVEESPSLEVSKTGPRPVCSDPGWREALDPMMSRNPFQPLPFYDSLMSLLIFMDKTHLFVELQIIAGKWLLTYCLYKRYRVSSDSQSVLLSPAWALLWDKWRAVGGVWSLAGVLPSRTMNWTWISSISVVSTIWLLSCVILGIFTWAVTPHTEEHETGFGCKAKISDFYFVFLLKPAFTNFLCYLNSDG